MAFKGTDLEDPLQLDAGASLVFEGLSKPTGLNDSLDLDRSDDDRPNVASTEEVGNVVMSPIVLNGILAYSYGEELMFNRIWIDPQVINPSFVSEDVTYVVETWNAWITRSVDWTAESIAGDTDGVLYDHAALTITINAFDEVLNDMILYGEGPATQDTVYTETIDGDDYEIDIDTIRVIGLDPEPNWIRKVKITYSFETVMASNERFMEQRRPLRYDLRRKLSIEFLVLANEAHTVDLLLQYGHDKAFACPIYPELMIPTTRTQGTTAVVVSTETTYLWNLNNACERIIIVDHINGQNEIKSISSVAAYQVNTTSTIQGTFTPASSSVYPIFIGTLHNHKIGHHTDDVQSVTLEFQEFIGG
jgi:hypothetical protein